MQRFVLAAILMTAPSLGAAAGAQSEKPAPELKTEADFRTHFAKQPRYLYGCGIIWAKWLWGDNKAKWAYDGRCMSMIKSMGGTNVPINIPWIDVETRPGQWTFEYVDHQVREAEKRNLPMFAYTGLTPDWALPPEAPKGMPGIGSRFPPPDEKKEEFITYCHKVAKRYKGRIKHYQFWNEPNGCSWVNDNCGNGDQYALYTKWLKIWYTAMKEGDPDCILGAGAIDYHEGVAKGYEYLEGMYRLGAKGHFDAFNIHPYDKQGTLHHRAIEDTRRVMVAHGDGYKGIWISEYGWPLQDEDEKARRLTQSLTELSDPKYYYVTMANYLSLSDPAGEQYYGLCDRDLKPRKSYLAFKQFVQEQRRRDGKPADK